MVGSSAYKNREADQSHTGGGSELAHTIADMGAAVAGQVQRHHGPDQQFPAPRRQQVEGRSGIGERSPLGYRQADEEDDAQDGAHPALAKPPGQHQEDGEEQVILLLDGKAPGVQQRLHFRAHVEVAGGAPEEHIRSEHGDRGQALGETLQLVRQQQDPRKRKTDGEHEEQRRQNPASAPLVKAQQAEGARVELCQQDAGNQVSADDKENIDADEAAAESAQTGVKQHHRQEGYSSQAINFGTIAHQGFSSY